MARLRGRRARLLCLATCYMHNLGLIMPKTHLKMIACQADYDDFQTKVGLEVVCS